MTFPSPPSSYSSPWISEHDLPRPFQHIAARTTDREYGPTPTDAAQVLSLTAFPPALAHHYRPPATRATKWPALLSPATDAQVYDCECHDEAMSTPRHSEDRDSWLPWWGPQYDDNPPPHTRPLYCTIPLPEVDEPEGFGAHTSPMWSLLPSSTQMTPPLPSNHSPSQFPVAPRASPHGSIDQLEQVRLHPILESSFSSSRSPMWVFDNEPATRPSTDHITAMIAFTGETIHILPSSPTSPHIVTVGDVLEALERVVGGHNVACDRCRAIPHQRRQCGCSRMSLDSVRLLWCSSDAARLYPWQLLVDDRRQR